MLAFAKGKIKEGEKGEKGEMKMNERKERKGREERKGDKRTVFCVSRYPVTCF